MLARIFSRVLLPDPLRPTMPKNSPSWMSNETSCSARRMRCSRRANGCVARSLSESTCCSGIRNVLLTPRASTTIGRSAMLLVAGVGRWRSAHRGTRRSVPVVASPRRHRRRSSVAGAAARSPRRPGSSRRSAARRGPPAATSQRQAMPCGERALAAERLATMRQLPRREPGERRRLRRAGEEALQRPALGRRPPACSARRSRSRPSRRAPGSRRSTRLATGRGGGRGVPAEPSTAAPWRT